MRLPRAQHMRLDALGALGRRAKPTVAGTAAPRWTRSAAASGGGANLFRRAPTPLAGENLPETRSDPPSPAQPWPKPRPVAAVPAPPAKPPPPVKRKTAKSDPASTFRRRAMPFEGEVLIDAQPVPPPPKRRVATAPPSSAATIGGAGGSVPQQDPLMFRIGVPTAMEGEELIEPRDPSRQKPTPAPEPAPATPLSREEARQLSLRKPALFEGEDTPIEIPVSLMNESSDQVGGDDEPLSDVQWADHRVPDSKVPDRKTMQEGKIRTLEFIYIDELLTFGIPPVSIRDSIRCVASYSQGPITGSPPMRTLYVPGSPSVFKQREFPHFLTPGPFQAFVKPTFRYEAALLALRAMSDINLDDIDVVLSGIYLRTLFSTCSDKRFITDKHNAPKLCTLVRDTLFIHGVMTDDQETLKHRAKRRPNHLQRGHMFQDNFTEASDDRFHGADYYRVLRYRLGDLNCLVIVETDTVLPWNREGDSDGQPPPSLDDTELSEEIPLDVQPVPRGPVVGNGWRPAIEPAGKFVEHRTWTELKLGGTSDFSDVTSQMYFYNQLFAIFGILRPNKLPEDRDHPDSWTRVKRVEMRDFRDRVWAWEKEQQPALRRAVALLRRLRTIARSQGEGKTCMYTRTTRQWVENDPGPPRKEADEPAEEAKENVDKRVRDIGHVKACDMVVRVTTWHTEERPIPQELIDHFWSPPGSKPKPQRHPLLRYYKYPRLPWEASEIDDIDDDYVPDDEENHWQ